MRASQRGFSLVESAVGMAVVGIMFTSFFAGLSQSLSVVQSARETLRATQIMAEKMDTIRLYAWDNLTTAGYVPTSFKVPFDSKAATNSTSGIIYDGTVSIKTPALTESYSSSLREITVTLTWQSGKMTRQAEMTTWVSQYGMQNYIISN